MLTACVVSLQISFRLLDDTLHHIIVSKGATIKDVLVAARRLLVVRADADYSLYLKQATPDGRDVFACLPDVMPAEEADALARKYRREQSLCHICAGFVWCAA